METIPGFEPGNRSFADFCLTIWLYRPRIMELPTGLKPASLGWKPRAQSLYHGSIILQSYKWYPRSELNRYCACALWILNPVNFPILLRGQIIWGDYSDLNRNLGVTNPLFYPFKLSGQYYRSNNMMQYSVYYFALFLHSIYCFFFFKKWWTWQNLNLHRLPCKGKVLPIIRHAQLY